MWNLLCQTCQVDGLHIDGLPATALEQYPNLKRVERWKFGHLYYCSRCRRYWFLHEDQKKLSRIHDKLLPLAEQWNRKHLQINDSMLHELAKIGGIQDGSKNFIAVPCSIENTSGQKHEKALVLVSKQPPYFWYKPNIIHWADEIAAIAPSPYTLPFDIRKASAQKEHISMGYCPVGVEDKDGNKYVLGCETHFFDTDGAKGEDMTLSSYQGEWREDFRAGCEYGLLIWTLAFVVEHIKALVKPQMQLAKRPKTIWADAAQAYYFVDWFDGCEELITPAQRSYREPKK